MRCSDGDARPGRRRGRACVLAVFLVLVLAGCVRAEYRVTIEGETTAIAGQILYVTEDAAEGHDCSLWWSEESPFRGSDDATTTSEPFTEDGHPGCRFTLTDRTENLRNADGTTLITRDGDVVVFRVAASEAAGASPTEDATGGGPDITLSVTFPGPVLDGDGGLVDGNTVTFTDVRDLGQGIVVSGDAGDWEESTSSPLPWVIGGVAGLAVVGAVVAAVMHRQDRRNRTGAG